MEIKLTFEAGEITDTPESLIYELKDLIKAIKRAKGMQDEESFSFVSRSGKGIYIDIEPVREDQ